MEEDFSAPPTINLNLNEENANIVSSSPPKSPSEEDQKIKDEQNKITIGDNLEEKKKKSKKKKGKMKKKRKWK